MPRPALAPTFTPAALAFGLLAGTLLAAQGVAIGYRGFGVPAALLVLGLSLLLSLWHWGRAALWVGLGTLALLYLAALLTPLVPAALRHLTEAQAPAPAQAIIVLGGGLDCQGRVMNAASSARLSRGIDLWREGYAGTLVLSSQSDQLSPPACPRLSALQGERLNDWFTPAPRLLTMQKVADTADEAREAASLAESEGWHRVLLVTSPSHSARAAALFRAQLAAANLSTEVLSVPAEEWRFSVTGETAQDRLLGLNVVLYEYLSRAKAAL